MARSTTATRFLGDTRHRAPSDFHNILLCNPSRPEPTSAAPRASAALARRIPSPETTYLSPEPENPARSQKFDWALRTDHHHSPRPPHRTNNLRLHTRSASEMNRGSVA